MPPITRRQFQLHNVQKRAYCDVEPNDKIKGSKNRNSYSEF